MRTAQMELAAIEVAENVNHDQAMGLPTSIDREAGQLNAARWVGTLVAGAHFDALQMQAVCDKARWLSETEMGCNVLRSHAQARFNAEFNAR